MATTKVSLLTAKTTPTGTEELLINDGGVSKKITQTNLLSTALPLAGGTMTGNITLGTNTIDGLEINTTATSNLGLGTGAVDSITTGDYNVGVGDYALSSVDAGSNNTAIGYVTLNTTTSGNGNTSAGFYSLVVNTAGSYNVASGFKALHANTTASGNTGIGYYALAGNTTGINNVALGYQAGTTNTTGSSNIIIGDTIKTEERDKYVLLDIKELNRLKSTNTNIHDSYVKIPIAQSEQIYFNNTKNYGTVKYFNPILKTLDRLTIKIKDRGGKVLQSGGLDHTMVFAIKCLNNGNNLRTT